MKETDGCWLKDRGKQSLLMDVEMIGWLLTWISLNWPRFLSNKLAWINGSTWNQNQAQEVLFYQLFFVRPSPALQRNSRSCNSIRLFTIEVKFLTFNQTGPDVNSAADILAGLPSISSIPLLATALPFKLSPIRSFRCL